jgi:hypothetical protein
MFELSAPLAAVGNVLREGVGVMTLISELTGQKSRREPEAGLNARSRLMMPKVEAGESLAAKLLVAQKPSAEAEESFPIRTDLLIRGLVERLPKPDGVWSLDDRAKWLRTAASIFDLVYKTGDGERGEISVASAKQQADTPEKPLLLETAEQIAGEQ